MSVLDSYKAFLANDNNKEVAMYKIQAFVKVMLVTSAVVVNVVVLAIVGVPWASGDPPIDTGGGTLGGAGPPGGTADAPEGVSDADGLWSATVGGTEYAGLGAGDVGRLLWRGNKVSRLIVGQDGIPSTVQVCETFPAITLESSDSGRVPGETEITVNLDFAECMVTLSAVFSTNIGTTGTMSSVGPQTLTWSDRLSDEAIPVSWTWPGRQDQRRWNPGPPRCPSAGSSSRGSQVRGQLQAADGVGFILTEVTLDRCYRIDTKALTKLRYDCDADSPTVILIRWREDRCTGRGYRARGNSMAFATGNFHADPIGPSPPRWYHSINVELEGSSHDEERSCRISPRSTTNIHLGPLGVRFNCSSSSRVYNR